MRISCFLLIVILLLGACGRTQAPAPVVRPVKVYRVAPLGFVAREFAGMAVADDASDLAFKIAGQITEMNVSEGSKIQKGFVIARINPRDYELNLQASKSAYVTAKAQMERMARLLEHQAVSRQEYEIAQTRYAETKASYENAQDVLRDTKLSAPFPGIIERKYVSLYQRVQPGQTIVLLVNPVSRSVRFTMPESGIPLLEQQGQQFTVEFDNYPGIWFAARLKEYVPSSTEGTGMPVTLALTDARLDGNRYIITPGMSCSIRLKLDRLAGKDETSLPITALFSPDTGGKFVWIVTPDDRVEARPVTTGELFGTDLVTISSGLQPGERVVTAGVYQLRQGEKVRILPAGQ